jgi:hypothetical protein
MKKSFDVNPWFASKPVPQVICDDSQLHSLFAFPPLINAEEKRFVQPWWTEVCQAMKQYSYPITLEDTHNHSTIGNRKPGNSL